MDTSKLRILIEKTLKDNGEPMSASEIVAKLKGAGTQCQKHTIKPILYHEPKYFRKSPGDAHPPRWELVTTGEAAQPEAHELPKAIMYVDADNKANVCEAINQIRTAGNWPDKVTLKVFCSANYNGSLKDMAKKADVGKDSTDHMLVYEMITDSNQDPAMCILLVSGDNSINAMADFLQKMGRTVSKVFHPDELYKLDYF